MTEVKTKVFRKAEILEQAARLFLERGFKSTSVRDIAAAVGIEASSLYSHIKSKEDILVLLCDACAERYTGVLSKIMATPGQTGIDQLKQILSFHIDNAFQDPTSSTVFSDEWKNLPSERIEKFLIDRKEYENKWQAVIQDCIRQGSIREGEPAVIMHTLISSVRWIHHTKRKFTDKEQKSAKETILSMLFDGLAKR